MAQQAGKAKENGVKAEKSPGKHACPPGPHAHPHPGAGDDATSEGSQAEPVPENIYKRINALKHIHMDVQKLEHEMYVKLFLLEAEQHKKMADLLKKRSDIINGKYEPSAKESEFKLKEDEEKQEIGKATEAVGIPDFWQTIFTTSMQTAQLLNEEDTEALKFLTDVRVIYSDSPLGFKLDFEFKENPFFTNTVLTRSYDFSEGVEGAALYMASGLAPKTTGGTPVNWKAGKDTTKKEVITFQRNKKTGERRQIKKVEVQDSFFQFFAPSVTDLTSLAKDVEEDDEAAADDLADKAEQAEADFELASFIRTRVIPRALLFYTGDDDDDTSYGADDYDEGDEESDEDGDDQDDGESDSSESGGDGDRKGPAAGKGGKVSKGVPRR